MNRGQNIRFESSPSEFPGGVAGRGAADQDMEGRVSTADKSSPSDTPVQHEEEAHGYTGFAQPTEAPFLDKHIKELCVPILDGAYQQLSSCCCSALCTLRLARWHKSPVR